jgi:two-component system nitrogen regulation sensor histidine kinase NtrY
VAPGGALDEQEDAMSLRKKLLAVVALTVVLAVGAVAWVVTALTRRSFERSDEQRTAALFEQFQRQFGQRAGDVAGRVEAVASSEAVSRMALDLAHNPSNAAIYVNEAAQQAESQQLNFLEFTDAEGMIRSSAQMPARFGYKENSVGDLKGQMGKPSFLKVEDLSNGPALGLFAVRAAIEGDRPLYVIGGQRLDLAFLSTLVLPPGMHASLYPTASGDFSQTSLINPEEHWKEPQRLAGLLKQAQNQGREASSLIHWSGDPADDETVVAIPLNGQDEKPLAFLLVSSSRRPYVALKRQIEWVALLVGAAAILMAILFSGWAAAHITKPLEQFAVAAGEVAAGNLDARVDIRSNDEVGVLAEAFNRMTARLHEQRERLVQTERVAAWRELARRLAHELKNPLFPLQLTVENLIRARERSPEMFEEMFQESTSTLLAEIANLKQIVARFSEFSKMPEPQFQKVDVNSLVQATIRLFQPQLQSQTPISCEMTLDPKVRIVAADPELIHRAISNLVLNAIDAMPQGGTLTLATRGNEDRVTIQVADSGPGMTREECERLFTPYYTSKQHGTGLGLAIVQSVVSDHGGSISVRSEPGEGTTFVIELPRNLDRLPAPGQPSSATTTMRS